jgi:hypothetical protein
MQLETWTLPVKVTVDLDEIGGWTPQDIADVIMDRIEGSVSQLEGVANVECVIGERRLAGCPD